MLEGRTIFGAKSKLLYSEVALSRKPFGMIHMYIYTFLLRMTDTMTFPPGALFIIENFCESVFLHALDKL
jgi:hypothetical protein